MTRRTLVYAVLLVGPPVLLTSGAVSQEKGSPPEATRKGTSQPDASSDAEAQLETFIRYAMPGEHHRLLGKMAGRWNMAVKYRMNADTPIVESRGTCERKWILGNRFILEEFDGGNLALPFQGLAIYGYDSFENKYTSV